MSNEYIIQRLKNLLDELGYKIYDCKVEYITDTYGGDNDDEIRKTEKILEECKKQIIMI